MNELTKVRALYDDPPAPAEDVVARARVRMTEGAPALPRRVVLGSGVLAAAAAVTVVAALGSGGGGTGEKPSAEPTVMSARSILLSAATRVEQGPATGAYWYTRSINGTQAVVKGKGYLVEQRSERQSWMPTSKKAYHWLVERYLGAKPVGPADEAAWRRDGSPDRWRVSSGAASIDSRPHRQQDMLKELRDGRLVSAAEGQPYAVPESLLPGWTGQIGMEKVTPEKLRRLPADPVALRAYIEKHQRQGRPVLDRQDLDYMVFMTGTGLLTEMPISPEIRAATYRMLAGLPGVVARGAARDRLGRTGQAVALQRPRGPGGAGLTEERILIDPVTGGLLAVEVHIIKPMNLGGRRAMFEERAGQLQNFTVMLEQRWTDEPPKLPAKRYEVDANGDPLKPGCARC